MQPHFRDLLAWAHAHLGPFLSGVVWPILSGLAVVLFVPGDRAARGALAQSNPALKGVFDALRGLGLDPAKVLEGLHFAVFGKPVAGGGFGRLTSFAALCAIGGAFSWAAKKGVNTAWWPLVTGVLSLALRKRTPEEWEAMTKTNPRLKGVVLAIRGLGLDPAQVRDGLVRALRGSPASPPAASSELSADPASNVLTDADLSAPRAVVSSATDETPPERPVAIRASSPPSDPPPSAALIILGLAGLILSSSALVASCKMPPPDGCEPRTYRCDEHRPWVCSLGQRWTPLSEPCAVGGAVCCEVVGSSGRIIATCAPADRCLPRDAGTED